MSRVIVETRGGKIVEIYSDNQDDLILVVDWDEVNENRGDAIKHLRWKPSKPKAMPHDTQALVKQGLLKSTL